MPHVEYDNVPEMVLVIAKTIRPMDWNERVWRDDKEKWAKSANWRTWSLRVAYRVAAAISEPTQEMVMAGAEILEDEYETDTGLRDAHRIYAAMMRMVTKR